MRRDIFGSHLGLDGGDGPGGPGGEPSDPPTAPGEVPRDSALRTRSVTRMARRLTAPFERGADTLALTLRATGGAVSTVDGYDFAEHAARFGHVPQPLYILGSTRDVAVETTVTITAVDQGGSPSSVTIPIPAGTRAGTSFLIPLPGPPSATRRVIQLSMTPATNGQAADLWTITALLGNLARLLWVIGAERDAMRGQAAHVMAQRHLPTAEGLSLDLIGVDLGVPRFPPLPHSFDTATIALYHCDDKTGPTVADATTGHAGRPGHPGQLNGPVQVGVPGRYGRAFGFTAPSSVTVPSSTQFDLPIGASTTIECFVRPDPASTDGPILSRHPNPGGTGAGWVLSVGAFGQGQPHNVQFVLSDGGANPPAVLFAGISLPTDTLTHVAVVVDGPARRATLYIGGEPRTSTATGQLGPVAGNAPLTIGPAVGGFRGVLDEVRLSSAARTDFAPTLGEADDHYRRRLNLFRRWTLPTPANLTAILNELTGPIAGVADPLIVNDTNSRLVRGTRLVRVRPVSLRRGECLDGNGRRRVAEADAVGTAADEDAFDPAFLFRYAPSTVDFGAVPSRTLAPGEPPPDPHLIQVGLVDRLDRLAALAGAETSPPGRLLVDSAFDPRATDLRATGRAVMLGHSTVPPGRLAALAHRAGFDFVCHRPAASHAAPVYAAAALGDYFVIDLDPPAAGPIDIAAGATGGLTLRPAPPADAFVQWHIVNSGMGRGILAPDTGPSTPQHTATLQGTAPGKLVVKADLTLGRHTVSAARGMRIGLASAGLADGTTISADGRQGTPVTSVDDPGAFFDPAFLIRHNDARVNYGSAENNHLMQPAVGELLDALLAELVRANVSGQLSVTGAFNPGGDDTAKQGRKLVLRHSTLTAGQLARSAFAVGFSHLQRVGADLFARQAPGQLVTVRGPAAAESNGVIAVDEGSTVDLTLLPLPTALTTPGVTPALFGWSSGSFDDAVIALGSTTKPATTLTATAAGMAWVQAGYSLGESPAPYTFQVRLRPELDTPATVISKEQHDLIMNALNALHPIGVEVNTSLIRAHVVEVQGDELLQANPDYTYPKFRVRGALPPQVRKAGRG